MATIVPPTYHEVTHFYDAAYDSDDGLASDQEWASEIEEEIITISLSRNMDTSVLATSPKAAPAALPDRSPPPSPKPGSTTPSTKATRNKSKPSTQPGPADDRNGGEDDEDDPSGQSDEGDRGNATAGPSSQRAQSDQDDQQDGDDLPAAHTMSIIGLNTTTPYLKVNNQVFKGRVVELIGSELVWEMKDSRDVTPLPLMPSNQTIHFQPRLYEPAQFGVQEHDGWTPEPDYLQPAYLSKRGKTTCFSSDDDLSPSVLSDGGTTKIRNPNSTRPKGRPPKDGIPRPSRGPPLRPRGSRARGRGAQRGGRGSRGGVGSRGGKVRGARRSASGWALDSDEEDDFLEDDDAGLPSMRPRSQPRPSSSKPSKAKGKGKGKGKVVDSDSGSDGQWEKDNQNGDDDGDDEMQDPPGGPQGPYGADVEASPAPGPSRPRRDAARQRRVTIDETPVAMDVDDDLPAGLQTMDWNSD